MNPDLFIIILASAGASMLTFFSGFGLGTILLPVFLFFFDPIVSIALTAIVHFLNNLFKLSLLWKNIDWNTGLRFGIPAMIGSLGGSLLLFSMGSIVLVKYKLGDAELQIELLKILVAALLVFFAILEIIPFIRLTVTQKHLPVGGLISGFFGGLTGHQGAIRSLFMIKLGLGKEIYIATGVIIACFIDITRLSVYADHLQGVDLTESLPFLIAAVLAAFAGALAGNYLLKKVTLRSLQVCVAIMIIIFSFALGLGII